MAPRRSRHLLQETDNLMFIVVAIVVVLAAFGYFWRRGRPT
jgi:hypothetical protein